MSASFQNSFIVFFYRKNNVAYALISLAVLKWKDYLSVQLQFELPVQLLLELELNILVQNVIELEFELSIM